MATAKDVIDTMAPPQPPTMLVTPQGDPYIAATTNQHNVSMWDTYRLGNDAGAGAIPQPIPFFIVPEGQIGSGWLTPKSWSETNMKMARRLPFAHDFCIDRLIISAISSGNRYDTLAFLLIVANLIVDSIIEVKIDGSEVLVDHLVHWGGTGLTGPVGPAGANQYLNSNPTIVGRKRLAKPILLQERQKFEVNVIINTANTLLTNAAVFSQSDKIVLRVYLEGSQSFPSGR